MEKIAILRRMSSFAFAAVLGLIGCVAFAEVQAAPVTGGSVSRIVSIPGQESPNHYFLNELDEQNRLFYSGFEAATWANEWTVENGGNSDTYPNYKWCHSVERPDPPSIYDWGAIETNAPPFMYCWSYDDWNDNGVLDDTWAEGLTTTNAIDASDWSSVYLLYDTYYQFGPDCSPQVQVSTDNGSTWTTVATLTYTYWYSRESLDISEQVANSSFKIRFFYETTGESYQWLIDEVEVWGSNGDIDLEAPSVVITPLQNGAFEATDFEVTVTASDNVELSEVSFVYAKLSNGAISGETEVVLTESETPGEFAASIPSTFFTANDTIVYYAKAKDTVGMEATDPAGAPEYRFSNPVFPIDYSLQIYSMDEYSWYDPENATPVAIDTDNYYYCSSGISLSSLGLDNFNWFGETITHIYCGAKGWVIFSPEENQDITNNTSGIATTLPTTTYNYNLVQIASTMSVTGNFVYEVIDNKLILSYTATNWDGFNVVAQIVIDTEADMAFLNYNTFDFGTYTAAYIGFQSATRGLGQSFLSSSSGDAPDEEQSYVISLEHGNVTGVVLSSHASLPIEGAEVSLLDGDNEIASTITDANGNFSFRYYPLSDLTLSAVSIGYETGTVSSVEVPLGDTNTYNITLESASTVDSFTATVISADTNDQTVVGARVTIVGSTTTAVTNADGQVTFTNIPSGDLDFQVSFDTFNSTYHADQLFEDVPVYTDASTADLALLEILPPRNVTALPSERAVTLTWDEPLNHASAATLAKLLGKRESLIHEYEQVTTLSRVQKEHLNTLRAETTRLERLLDSSSGNLDELDDFEDFSGYRFQVDGELIEDAVASDVTSHTFELLENLVSHSFAIAADYGYGNENLVFSVPVIAAANGILAVDTSYTFDWIELRPSEGGTGTALNIQNDRTSSIISMEGMRIDHYSSSYGSFYVSENGLITYSDEGLVPGFSNGLPGMSSPNNIVAPLWTDFITELEDSYDVWYQVDLDNRRVVVQWSAALWPGTVYINEHNFELIIYPDLDTYVFQYLSATQEDGWLWYTSFYRDAHIGLENVDGTQGYEIRKSLVDNCAVMVRFLQDSEYGTVTATVMQDNPDGETDVPVAGAHVRVNGTIWPAAISGEDGTINFNVGSGTSHQFEFVGDGLWPSESIIANVTAGEVTNLGTVYLTTADMSLNPTSVEIEYYEETQQGSSTLELSSTGTGNLDYSISFMTSGDTPTTPTWISASPNTGNIESGSSSTITISVDPSDETLPSTFESLHAYFINNLEQDTTVVAVSYYFIADGVGETEFVPTEYALHPGTPNPFNPSTTIRYDLVQARHVSMAVYNMLGQKVFNLVNGSMPAGRHAVTFNGNNLASGIYLIRMDAGSFHAVQKVVLMK